MSKTNDDHLYTEVEDMEKALYELCVHTLKKYGYRQRGSMWESNEYVKGRRLVEVIIHGFVLNKGEQ